MLGDTSLHQANYRAQAAGSDDDRVEGASLRDVFDRLGRVASGRQQLGGQTPVAQPLSGCLKRLGVDLGVVPRVDRNTAFSPGSDAYDGQFGPECSRQLGPTFECPVGGLVAVVGDQDLLHFGLLPSLGEAMARM